MLVVSNGSAWRPREVTVVKSGKALGARRNSGEGGQRRKRGNQVSKNSRVSFVREGPWESLEEARRMCLSGKSVLLKLIGWIDLTER